MCDVSLPYTDERTACFMAMDLAREKQIDLASNFPFEELSAGECLISREYSELFKLTEGSQVDMSFNEPDLWSTLARHYDE